MPIIVRPTHLVLLVLVCCCWPAEVIRADSVYRFRQAIQTELRLLHADGSSSEATLLRYQTPAFGVSSQADIEIPTKRNADEAGLSTKVQSVALTFDDGMRALPSISILQNPFEPKAVLKEIDVTFIYSLVGGGNSEGSIHNVRSEAKYNDSNDAESSIVRIHYRWIEETQYHLQGGQMAMFAVSLAFCIYFFLISCALIGDEKDGKAVSNPKAKVRRSAPKAE
jgi:hypothetical protein